MRVRNKVQDSLGTGRSINNHSREDDCKRVDMSRGLNPIVLGIVLTLL